MYLDLLHFRYFALNTEMRYRALQIGRVYVHQNPHDAHFSVDKLREMVGQAFTNRVLHFGATLRGTRQFWFKQKSRLVAMVDTLGLPTVFFTRTTRSKATVAQNDILVRVLVRVHVHRLICTFVHVHQ